jgi:hypothetical protein
LAAKKTPIVVPDTPEKAVRTKQRRGGVDGRPYHDKPVMIRFTEYEKDVVDSAATYEGKSTSFFAAEAAVDRAHEVNRRRNRLTGA